MDSSTGRRRPRTVKEVTELAETFEFNTFVSFKHWVRAAETLYQEANYALDDGDFERAYLMLYRHSKLVVDHLRTHPEYQAHKATVRPLYSRQQRVFEELERLKPLLQKEHENWTRLREAQDRRREQQHHQRQQSQGPVDPAVQTRGFGIRPSPGRELDAADNQDLAVDLAQKEIMRRETTRYGGRLAGYDERNRVRYRNRDRGRDWDRDPGYDSRNSQSNVDDWEFRRQMEATRRQLEEREAPRHSRYQDRPRNQSYQYPSISKPIPVQYEAETPSSSPYFEPPPHPPKDRDILPPPRREGPPRIPRKDPLPNFEPLQPSNATYDNGISPGPLRPPKEEYAARTPSPPPPPQRKERVQFKPSSYLENGEPLRPVFLPSDIRARFLEVAAENTRRGLEMCGMLCGSPVNNALFVRYLVIPDQKCTTDTCETENEDRMLEYCIEQDLIIIGWIHTHPTQTCFMSSRDLHTHAGYQVMMPESIAIVCAPRSTPSYGVFRLTKPPGLNSVLKCTKKETFHVHDVANLYTEAMHPDGHVYETSRLPFEVKDLRTKRTY